MGHEKGIEQDQFKVFSSASIVHELNPTKQVTNFWLHDIGVGAGPVLAGPLFRQIHYNIICEWFK